MKGTTLSAKPMQALRLGRKQIIVCQIVDENPVSFVGKRFLFHTEGGQRSIFTIEGVSTASQFDKGICDFSYSGDEISPSQIRDDSLIQELL